MRVVYLSSVLMLHGIGGQERRSRLSSGLGRRRLDLDASVNLTYGQVRDTREGDETSEPGQQLLSTTSFAVSRATTSFDPFETYPRDLSRKFVDRLRPSILSQTSKCLPPTESFAMSSSGVLSMTAKELVAQAEKGRLFAFPGVLDSDLVQLMEVCASNAV
jgi:hypothetical protein